MIPANLLQLEPLKWTGSGRLSSLADGGPQINLFRHIPRQNKPRDVFTNNAPPKSSKYLPSIGFLFVYISLSPVAAYGCRKLFPMFPCFCDCAVSRHLQVSQKQNYSTFLCGLLMSEPVRSTDSLKVHWNSGTALQQHLFQNMYDRAGPGTRKCRPSKHELCPEDSTCGKASSKELISAYFSYFHFAVLPGFRSVWALPIRPGKVRM